MPQLDRGFEIFANWQTVVYCLAIYFLTYVIRTVVEALWKGAKDSNLWNELGLHCGPIGTGVVIVLLVKFPWPMPIADVPAAKVMYGGICGGMSGFVYGRIRAWLGVAADSASPAVQKFASKLGAKPSNPPPPMKAEEKVPETKPEEKPADKN